ncbi:MAG: class I SAM-dependent methyltransferase [Planctomycetes bacterium]|nr:class I SAM-dependent methyltransferase [Planctomycetota bacterium]
MDPLKFTTIGHGGMAICNPLGEAALRDALDAIVSRLPTVGARAIDVGCGKAELLLRLMERRKIAAIGVDINPAFLAEARAQAKLRGCALELRQHSYAEFLAHRNPGDALFDAVLCIGASHAVGSPREAPAILAKLLKPGGSLLLGEGYWRREPDREYLSALGAARDNFADHAGNQRLGAEAGLKCVHAVETSVEDFNRYESNYGGAIDAYVAAHPEDPDGPAMADRIKSWREAYMRWGRDTLGFGLYLFVVPAKK